MKGIAITVGYADDDAVLLRYRVEPFDGDGDALRAVVGGWLEAAPSDESVTIWVNEDGKGLGLPINRLAMDVWIRWDVYGCMTAGGDYLVGNVVVTGGVDQYGNTKSIPRAAAEWVLTVAEDAGAEIVP